MLYMSDVHLSLEDTESAMRTATTARRIFKEKDDKRGEAGAVQKIAAVHKANSRPVEALRAVEGAVTLWREAGDRRGMVEALLKEAQAKADILEDRGEKLPASWMWVLGAAKVAVCAAKDSADQTAIGDALYTLAKVQLKINSANLARVTAGDAAKIFRKSQDQLRRAHALVVQASANVQCKVYEKAQQQAVEASAIFNEFDDANGGQSAQEVLHQIDSVLGVPLDQSAAWEPMVRIADKGNDLREPSVQVKEAVKTVAMGLTKEPDTDTPLLISGVKSGLSLLLQDHFSSEGLFQGAGSGSFGPTSRRA